MLRAGLRPFTNPRRRVGSERIPIGLFSITPEKLDHYLFAETRVAEVAPLRLGFGIPSTLKGIR